MTIATIFANATVAEEVAMLQVMYSREIRWRREGSSRKTAHSARATAESQPERARLGAGCRTYCVRVLRMDSPPRLGALATRGSRHNHCDNGYRHHGRMDPERHRPMAAADKGHGKEQAGGAPAGRYKRSKGTTWRECSWPSLSVDMITTGAEMQMPPKPRPDNTIAQSRASSDG